MTQLLILLLFLAPGDLEGRLPDNTIAVLSAKPREIAKTPAFLAIVKEFRRYPGVGGALNDLDSLTGIDFFRDVEEITLVLPADFELRKSWMVHATGDFRLGGLLALAEAKKMEIAESEKAGACILSLPGSGDAAIGILEDGSLLIASRKTIERHGRGTLGPRGDRLAKPVNAALDGTDPDSMAWGVVSLPAAMNAAAVAGTGLPFGHVESIRFEVDAAADFRVTLWFTLHETMKPAEFIAAVRKRLAITEAAAPRKGKNRSQPSGSKKDDDGSPRVVYVRKGGWLPEDLEFSESGERGVTISFRITTQKAKELLASRTSGGGG